MIILINLSCAQIIAEEDTLKLKLNKLLITPEEVLSPDKAFTLFAEMKSSNHLKMTWKISDQCFLYKDKFKFKFNPKFKHLLEIKNKPKKIDDLYFGNVDVFYNNVEIVIALDNNLQKILDVTYQGCNENGYCYPPVERRIKITADREISIF